MREVEESENRRLVRQIIQIAETDPDGIEGALKRVQGWMPDCDLNRLLLGMQFKDDDDDETTGPPPPPPTTDPPTTIPPECSFDEECPGFNRCCNSGQCGECDCSTDSCCCGGDCLNCIEGDIGDPNTPCGQCLAVPGCDICACISGSGGTDCIGDDDIE